MSFTTDYAEILARFENIDPEAYGRTRNFANGAVTRLSPYISRGVISTKQVMNHLRESGLPFYKMEKLIQELAWRDYWQQVWVVKGDEINFDLRQEQWDVSHLELPLAVQNAQTGIRAVDEGINSLYETGYMHNHMRMYVAAIACNMAKSHWKTPARWMYYHLLDGDWASNALSWQWVAGANAGKKYVANQDNINKYFPPAQKGTFLDVDYSAFDGMECPEELKETCLPELQTLLPETKPLEIKDDQPTLVYNYYNLDPAWRTDEKANRILLLEPEHFERYPVSNSCLDFALELGNNIPGLQVVTDSFESLANRLDGSEIIYKEHPLNRHYQGIEDQRDWMFEVKGYYRSFFAFWKQCQKEIKPW